MLVRKGNSGSWKFSLVIKVRAEVCGEKKRHGSRKWKTVIIMNNKLNSAFETVVEVGQE